MKPNTCIWVSVYWALAGTHLCPFELLPHSGWPLLVTQEDHDLPGPVFLLCVLWQVVDQFP